MNSTYTRFELLRTFRNRRFLIFSLGFPLALYFLIAGPEPRRADLGGTGIPAPLYYMVGLAAFGAMGAMLSTGARIAGERSVGWNRQLRIDAAHHPRLFPRQGADRLRDGADHCSPAVRRRPSLWRAPAGGRMGADDDPDPRRAVPFAALGVRFGHLLTTDTIGPAMGGLTPSWRCSAARGSRSTAA